MLLIVGDRYDIETLGTVNVRCPNCRSSPCLLFLARKKLTLYTIPTFNLSSSFLLRCQNCGHQWEVDREVGERLQAQANPAPGASATRVASPAPGSRSPGPPGGSTDSMATCARCGTRLPPTARFCQGCGAPRDQASPPDSAANPAANPTSTCRACGNRQPASRFCSRCGAAL